MKLLMTMMAALMMAATMNAQKTITYSMQEDSTGVYIISRVLSGNADTLYTQSEAVRFNTIQDAVPTLQALKKNVQQNKARLAALYQANDRNEKELDAILEKAGPVASDTPKQPSELEKLRAENAALKAQIKKE